MAPLAAAFDCRATGLPAECKCCKDPEAGCCAGNREQPGKPVPVAPANTPALRDLAAAPATVIAVVPPIAPREFPGVSSCAVAHPPHVARHSLLCIRTV